MTCRPVIQPADLSSNVEDQYGLDAGEFPQTINTPFGQLVVLIEQGRWTGTLTIEHVGCKRVIFQWGSRFSKHELLEWTYRTWAIERMQRRVDLRPASLVGVQLGKLDGASLSTVRRLEDAITQWAVNVCESALRDRQPQVQIGLRSFFAWGLEEHIPGFTEYGINRVLEVSMQKHGTPHLVSILDPDEGPLTFSELRSIESALDARAGLVEEKAIYYLGRDWGLRPVQIALLRVTDVGMDDLGPYVWVPSVKGIRRSALRRHPSNLKKRYVTPETYASLLEAIDRAHSVADVLRNQLVARSICSEQMASTLPTPLFPAPRTKRRSKVIAAAPAIADYLLHADASLISRNARKLTQILRVARPGRRQDIHGDEYLEIGLLRLRRTKGTSMVLNGASPLEVAEALDHQTTQTIAHYFKLNRDLIEWIDASQSKNVDIRAAADAWAGRLIASTEGANFPKLQIGNLGICTLGQPCPHHPAVSCYSCKRFEPYIDGDHQVARANILQFKEMVESSATGPVAKQLDAAIRGVDAIILAVEEVRRD